MLCAEPAGAEKEAQLHIPAELGRDITHSTEPATPLTGTLFFSDRERSRLDQIRNRPKRSLLQDGGSGPGVRSIINGYVRRSDGVVTVWVDGTSINQANTQLATKIDAKSVGTTIADVHISVINRVSKEPMPSMPTRRAVQKPPVTKARPK